MRRKDALSRRQGRNSDTVAIPTEREVPLMEDNREQGRTQSKNTYDTHSVYSIAESSLTGSDENENYPGIEIPPPDRSSGVNNNNINPGGRPASAD